MTNTRRRSSKRKRHLRFFFSFSSSTGSVSAVESLLSFSFAMSSSVTEEADE
eukprot:CAMPEP_0201967810 /NCGR_PEP_ID=MMETSP0904-20121228/12388_1 /ASSEMBLY_ACC=CAM_ASM_000553 /TAXON_ID=420261 /ORGANISM="Thalassiosira antarctica, Strain CCMP982" /LENGTH=51 /DNA_ID=CAMNT_0048515349 /DNA_START=12 /DNA_END=164 /DNA_ORIENTATION=-